MVSSPRPVRRRLRRGRQPDRGPVMLPPAAT